MSVAKSVLKPQLNNCLNLFTCGDDIQFHKKALTNNQIFGKWLLHASVDKINDILDETPKSIFVYIGTKMFSQMT